MRLQSNALRPGGDGTNVLGTAANRWSTVYAATGTINTSDAREKTAVAPLTEAEIAAAKQLSKEIGSYKFLQSIAEKGESARMHVGMTVQRAIEIMESHNLVPFSYGFICYDEWGDEYMEHGAVEARDAVLKDDTVVSDAVVAKAAWTEQTRAAGNRYAFRYDQLVMFLMVGFEARLQALEDNL